MKKIICFGLVLLALFGCLTACNFTQNMSGAIAGKAEATPKVEEMMAALADDNTSDAKALLHPQVVETSDNAIAQMSTYLAGRKASAIELISININSSAGTAGKTRQEQVGYQVTLTDGAVIFLNAVYLSDNQGTGFASFQLVLGVV
ncbi:MAG: hypothetical protein Q4B92_01160 [Ruminococcus sp.]|nr:hypothetical protein [Ruminococcus sp.]